MGRPGSALDNTIIESWHSTLEFELRSVEHFTGELRTGTGGLTCSRFSRPQGCASARPRPGRSSAGLTALAGPPPGQALRPGALIGQRRPRAKTRSVLQESPRF
jgi:hypothetical protein